MLGGLRAEEKREILMNGIRNCDSPRETKAVRAKPLTVDHFEAAASCRTVATKVDVARVMVRSRR
jgi:hypothetical protein